MIKLLALGACLAASLTACGSDSPAATSALTAEPTTTAPSAVPTTPPTTPPPPSPTGPTVMSVEEAAAKYKAARVASNAANARYNNDLDKGVSLSQLKTDLAAIMQGDRDFITALGEPETWPVKAQPAITRLIRALSGERAALRPCADPKGYVCDTEQQLRDYIDTQTGNGGALKEASLAAGEVRDQLGIE